MPGLFDQEYIYIGRAPRGARGLKCTVGTDNIDQLIVVPLAGHVD